MGKHDVPIVRIVVKGCPSAKPGATNVLQAHDMLLKALADDRWPGNAQCMITPGGFVVAPFPARREGERGWASRTRDFRALVPHARKAVDRVLTPRVLAAAQDRVDFLTLGVDLNDGSAKRKMDRKPRGTHAELVTIIDVEKGEPVHWTGKSYPVYWQERTLVQETDLESHLVRWGKDRVLVLGCHDLNMFSPRAWANMKARSPRRRRSTRMRDLAGDFKPTIILHHPHSTDTPRIWATAWRGARALLPEKHGGRHIWASSIGYYVDDGKPRAQLRDVLRDTLLRGAYRRHSREALTMSWVQTSVRWRQARSRRWRHVFRGDLEASSGARRPPSRQNT